MEFKKRLRMMSAEDQAMPSKICRFMMDAYNTENSERKFQNQFEHFTMKPSSNYASFLDELMIQFAKAEPEMNANWSHRAAEKVIIQYYNGMLPGKREVMRDFLFPEIRSQYGRNAPKAQRTINYRD